MKILIFALLFLVSCKSIEQETQKNYVTIKDKNFNLYFASEDQRRIKIVVCNKNRSNCIDVFKGQDKTLKLLAYDLNMLQNNEITKTLITQMKTKTPIIVIADTVLAIMSQEVASNYLGDNYEILAIKLGGTTVEFNGISIISTMRIPRFSDKTETAKSWLEIFTDYNNMENGRIKDFIVDMGRFLIDEKWANRSEISKYCMIYDDKTNCKGLYESSISDRN